MLSEPADHTPSTHSNAICGNGRWVVYPGRQRTVQPNRSHSCDVCSGRATSSASAPHDSVGAVVVVVVVVVVAVEVVVVVVKEVVESPSAAKGRANA